MYKNFHLSNVPQRTHKKYLNIYRRPSNVCLLSITVFYLREYILSIFENVFMLKKYGRKMSLIIKKSFMGFYIHWSLRNIFVKVKKFILFSAGINIQCSVYFIMYKILQICVLLGNNFFYKIYVYIFKCKFLPQRVYFA